MIPKAVEAQILRLYHAERWPVNTIATTISVHHSVVERVLAREGLPRCKGARASKLDAYVPYIDTVLQKYPKLCASRLYHMCVERGYVGSESHFRSKIRDRRPRPIAEAYMRLRTLPGEQAQVDWGYFGKVQVGRASRRLIAFATVLSYSRMIFVRFYFGDNTANFLHGHCAAFHSWGGVPRVALYDNLKSAVLERDGELIRFNPRMLEFAGHYRFEARPVAVARGNEKGRVERAIRYIRDSFFAARKWRDIDDLNSQVDAWCIGLAANRRWPEDTRRSVREVFEDEERPRLLALPDDDYACDERSEVAIGKTPYARFDRNDYSIPHQYVRRTMTVVASLTTVRVLDGLEVVAEHPRSFDKGMQIENPDHIRDLREHKHAGKKDRGVDRLSHAVPSSRKLLTVLAERGENLGSATSWMLRLLDDFGAVAVEAAVVEAIANDAPHPQAVRHILDRQRRASGRRPALPVHLPMDPRVRDVTVRTHDLGNYDRIATSTIHDIEQGDNHGER